jgi:hypothetical protein
MPTLTHDPDVRAQQLGGLAVADYTSYTEGDARRCDGHRTDNTAGYIVRRTLDEDGQVVTDPATPDRVGVDVYAVACEPGWGHYDKAAHPGPPHRPPGADGLHPLVGGAGVRGRR